MSHAVLRTVFFGILQPAILVQPPAVVVSVSFTQRAPPVAGWSW